MSNCMHENYHLDSGQWVVCDECGKRLYAFSDLVDHCLLRDEAEAKFSEAQARVEELEEFLDHLAGVMEEFMAEIFGRKAQKVSQ